MRHTLSPAATLFHADCRDAIKVLPSDSLDSCVTDPPYALVSIVKRFGGANAAPPTLKDIGKGASPYMRASAGFMGKQWDTGETAFSVEFWAEVFRVLKPGAFVAAFGASRGYHRMACAIEDAGFEIRDSLMWCYGVGFPKSHNISAHETFCQCGAVPATERNVRPMHCDDVSPPLDTGAERREVLQPGVSQLGASVTGRSEPSDHARDGQSGMEGWCDVPPPPGQLRPSEIRSLSAGPDGDGASGRLRDGTPIGHGTQDWASLDADGMRASSRPQAAAQRADESGTVAGQSFAQDGGAWENCGRCGKPMVPDGLGTALKPAFEPIVLARKPLSEGTVAANVLRWRTGALNIDASRIPGEPTGVRNNNVSLGSASGGIYGSAGGFVSEGHAQGRWPANVVTDGSDEVVAAFPNLGKSTGGKTSGSSALGQGAGWNKHNNRPTEIHRHNDSGSAARFFYSAKASKQDRNGSKHPTVKPISLMEWLATLITPPGGTILDPFAGSGTTGIAATRRGFSVILCEREAEYVADIRNRFALPNARSPVVSLDAVRADIEAARAIAALQARLLLSQKVRFA